MNVSTTAIDGVLLIEPKVFGDARGCFFESYNRARFQAAGIAADFIQDNESRSRYGVLRGLHYQRPPYAQAKLVRVIAGRALDIVVDLRRSSPTFSQHVAVELSGENKRQLFVPRGMAHGFAVLSDEVIFAYKCDNYYAPDYERTIRFDDPALSIDWLIPAAEALLSPKDLKGVPFVAAELFD